MLNLIGTALSVFSFAKKNPKVILWIVIFILSAGLAWKIYGMVWDACKAEQNRHQIIALENALKLEREYLNHVLVSQAKNQKFITRQRKALQDAKENDAPAAPVLINTINRLHNDTGDVK